MKQLYDNVVMLAKGGHPPKNIAKWLNMSKQTVYYYIKKARDAGEDIPQFDTAGNVKGVKPVPNLNANELVHPATDHRNIVVPLRLKSLLDKEAERLGKTPSEVARNILEQGLLAGASRHD